MSTVTLKDGNTVELRDPEKLTNGQRKPLMRAVARTNPKVDPATGEPTIAGEAALDVGEAAITVFVAAWSFPFPIPADDPASIDAMPAYAYDELQLACGELMDKAVLDTSAKKVAEPELSA